MSINHTQINTTAVIALTRCLQEGDSRRTAIVKARDELMKKLDMTRDSAELACWRVMAELETRKVPQGHSIDLTASTTQLLVIKSPDKKLVFTLSDLLDLHKLHGESAADTDQLKPTIH